NSPVYFPYLNQKIESDSQINCFKTRNLRLLFSFQRPMPIPAAELAIYLITKPLSIPFFAEPAFSLPNFETLSQSASL
ncbi:MAG: hypothetical protein ABSA06_10810, partial [Geobacteraceae bacterium]